MNEHRIIKKYPNRRLYDTEESRYIKLSDIRQLIVDSVPFRVIEKRSESDITHAVLLQVVAEQSSQAETLFTETLLSELVHRGRGPVAPVIGRFLEQGLRLFIYQQELFDQKLRETGNRTDAIRQTTEQTASQWRSLQEALLGDLP
ncbi:MAG: polyhydroxyalkanoate synthesis regulator DNA-binding domain-containing protein [Gammaproteobacteria bacterium]|jgi:polyhydroxyalkanoate synthesis repressor PhaR